MQDQESLMFTGKINILNAKTSEMTGVITMIDGEINSFRYKNFNGLDALVLIFFEEAKYANLKYLIEPEILKRSTNNNEVKFSEILPEIKRIYKEMWNSSSLRPKNDLIFLLNGDFLLNGPVVTKEEFLLMRVIVDFNKVSEIYQHSFLTEHFTTSSLVSLRKKGAIKVLKYK